MKKMIAMMLLLAVGGTAWAAEPVFEQKFDENFKLNAAQSAFASIKVLEDEKPALVVDYPEAIEKVTPVVTIHLKPELVAGEKVKFTVEVKAEGISKPEKHFLDGKFTLMVVDHENKTAWPGLNLGGGTFDWKERSFTADIPYGARNVTVMLGMQGTTGKICFRNLKVEIIEQAE